MSHSAHHHDHSHDHGGHEPKGPWWARVHRDWRFWTAVVLMIAAMLVYVFSLDEALRPTGVGPKAPAAP